MERPVVFPIVPAKNISTKKAFRRFGKTRLSYAILMRQLDFGRPLTDPIFTTKPA